MNYSQTKTLNRRVSCVTGAIVCQLITVDGIQRHQRLTFVLFESWVVGALTCLTTFAVLHRVVAVRFQRAEQRRRLEAIRRVSRR
jgi:hypothetical protein